MMMLMIMNYSHKLSLFNTLKYNGPKLLSNTAHTTMTHEEIGQHLDASKYSRFQLSWTFPWKYIILTHTHTKRKKKRGCKPLEAA